MPLTTKMNNPRVSTVSGSVRIRMTGRITAFTIPRSTAETSKARQPPMFIPGTIVAAAQRPRAVMTSRKKKPRTGEFPGLQLSAGAVLGTTWPLPATSAKCSNA